VLEVFTACLKNVFFMESFKGARHIPRYRGRPFEVYDLQWDQAFSDLFAGSSLLARASRLVK
jgi:hypothetical protein